MYPSTIEQLENTNRMRFLRHRYKDPFTGKDDWRMLHAGPGGQLTDSKVKPVGLGNVPGSGSDANSSSSFGSASTGTGFGSSTNTGSGFGQSGFGQSGFGSSENADAVVVPNGPQRPPAISANGAPTVRSGDETAGAPGESDQSADLRQQIAAAEQSQPVLPSENAGQTGSSETAGANANQSAAGASQSQLGQGQAGQNGASGQAGASGVPSEQNAMDTMRKMLGNSGSGNPAIGAPLQGGTSGTGGIGQISNGGIAGVASKAKGHTIKVVNDQTDYSLWEFYYDPTKDLTKGMPGIGNATGNNGQPGAGTNGTNAAGSGGQSMFQTNSSQSGFGQSGMNSPPAGTTSPGPSR